MIYPRGFTFVSPDDKAKIILRQSQQSKNNETGLELVLGGINLENNFGI